MITMPPVSNGKFACAVATEIRLPSPVAVRSVPPACTYSATIEPFQAPPAALMLYLGFFAGFLLYIGVSDILPEAHSGARPATAIRLIALTELGSAFIFGVARLAG